MKKILIFGLLALAVMGCNHNPKPNNPGPVNACPSKVDMVVGDPDMAIFDNGKIIFYNSAYDTFIPFVAEDDYVVNGVFRENDAFNYTVAIEDELYLKKINLGYFRSTPELLTDWNLKLSDCYGAENDLAAPMFSYSNVSLIRMDYELYEEFGEFLTNRYYNIDTQTITDEWPDDIVLGDGLY